jgi:Domain of unknown function (DUF4145)
MAFSAAFWQESFHPDDLPPFPCPKCEVGRLQMVDRSLRFKEHPLFCSTKLFQLFMKCTSVECEAVVAVSGRTEIGVVFINGDYEEFLRPESMIPAPPIIEIPRETPDSVRKEIERSFELFWVDLGACANRLRISMERILDEATVVGDTLAERISLYSSSASIHQETLHALRIVGNLGSHEGNVQREVLCDAFHIYEDALAELYGRRTAKAQAIRDRLLKGKGRYISES